jgi:DNA-binding transcriptional MerR regulator
MTQQNDPVMHPSHYTSGHIEVIDFITDQQLDFCLGNVVKYVSRAGKKEEQGKTISEKQIEDLRKARFYLNYKIQELEEKNKIDLV